MPENRKLLNYGRVNFFTDADDDGIHIRALLADFFYVRFPSLWKAGYFNFESESTPVVKIYPTKNSKQHSHLFYSNNDVKKFYETHKFTGHEQIDYYKGLATIDNSEHKYLAENRKKITFTLDKDNSQEHFLRLAFDEKERESRKKWMLDCMKLSKSGVSVEQCYDGQVTLSNFINDQLVIFEIATLKRALPSVFDGLKDGQRKILYTLFKSNITEKTGVVNIQGRVLDLAKYHHGAASITGAIINMAQRFVGTNNLPIIKGYGQFGTRDDGGKKSAGADRYIKASLEVISKIIFNKEDNELLTYTEDQGEKVEPEFYSPIVCMLAINGAEGMATGFSTNIPPHNPLDVVSYQEAWIDGNQASHKKLIPWWRGFTGKVELLQKPSSSNKTISIDYVQTEGILEKETKNAKLNGWWNIRELPIGMWTSKMKEYIENMMSVQKDKKGKERPICIADMKEYHGENKVHFIIKPSKDFIPDINTKQNFNNLKSTIALTNMRALDENGYPKKYPTIESLIDDYCEMRLKYYELRYKSIIKNIESAIPKVSNKVKFVVAVINKKIKLYQEDDALEKEMLGIGLEKISSKEGETKTFDYLLTMPIKSMTKKKVEDLKKELEKLRVSLEEIKTKSPRILWKEDLEEFKKEYAKFDKEN